MTQCERVIAHLKSYGTITAKEAFENYGIMRLGSRINDLRRAGQHIVTETIEGRNKYNEKTRYARYRLQKGV